MLFFKKRKQKLSEEEKERLQDEKDLLEYNRRQARYNDMLRDEVQKQRFKNNINKVRLNTFTKRLVAIIVGICIIDLQLSYVLAFLGKSATIEGLSTQLCNTILGVAFVYMIRAYFDTRAENKNVTEKTKSELKEYLDNKINNVLNAAGINITTPQSFGDEDDDSLLKGGFHVNKPGINLPYTNSLEDENKNN